MISGPGPHAEAGAGHCWLATMVHQEELRRGEFELIEQLQTERQWRAFREARGMSLAEVEVLRLSRYAGPPWKPFERFAHSRRDVLVFCSLSVPQAFGWLQAMYSLGTWVFGFATSLMH
jgi:hypothetical protein